MATEEQQISWIANGGNLPLNVDATGATRIGFQVIRIGPPPSALAGIKVSVDIVDYQADASPVVSTDGTNWRAGVDAETDRAGQAWFMIRSGKRSSTFSLTAGIDDFRRPRHKIQIPLTTHAPITKVIFVPAEERGTLQGELFEKTLAITVQTQPESTERITVELVGPATAAEPDDFNVHFQTGERRQRVTSGEPLPPIRAGRMAGEATLKASVGDVAASLTWHVLPVPDHLASPRSGQSVSIHQAGVADQLPEVAYVLSGHKVLRDSTSQSMPVSKWSVRMTLDSTAVARFKGVGADAKGENLVILTDSSGAAKITASQLDISGALNKSFRFHAAWNTKANGRGNWISGSDGGVLIRIVS